MEIKWLEDFLSLAKTGSFSQSAVARNVTQSTFSRRIKALEIWLGVALVDRNTYPTRFTDAGRSFKNTADELLRELYQTRDRLRRESDKLKDQVSFSAMHTLSLNYFPKWLLTMEKALGPLNAGRKRIRRMAAVPANLFLLLSPFLRCGNLEVFLSFSARRQLFYGAAAIPREVTDNALLVALGGAVYLRLILITPKSTRKNALKA